MPDHVSSGAFVMTPAAAAVSKFTPVAVLFRDTVTSSVPDTIASSADTGTAPE